MRTRRGTFLRPPGWWCRMHELPATIARETFVCRTRPDGTSGKAGLPWNPEFQASSDRPSSADGGTAEAPKSPGGPRPTPPATPPPRCRGSFSYRNSAKRPRGGARGGGARGRGPGRGPGPDHGGGGAGGGGGPAGGAAGPAGGARDGGAAGAGADGPGDPGERPPGALQEARGLPRARPLPLAQLRHRLRPPPGAFPAPPPPRPPPAGASPSPRAPRWARHERSEASDLRHPVEIAERREAAGGLLPLLPPDGLPAG